MDWSWGGYTQDNTEPERWDAAHRAAGPLMQRSGWLMVASGVIGAVVMLFNEPFGLAILLILVVLSLGAMFWSIGRGLRVLGGHSDS